MNKQFIHYVFILAIAMVFIVWLTIYQINLLDSVQEKIKLYAQFGITLTAVCAAFLIFYVDKTLGRRIN